MLTANKHRHKTFPAKFQEFANRRTKSMNIVKLTKIKWIQTKQNGKIFSLLHYLTWCDVRFRPRATLTLHVELNWFTEFDTMIARRKCVTHNYLGHVIDTLQRSLCYIEVSAVRESPFFMLKKAVFIRFKAAHSLWKNTKDILCNGGRFTYNLSVCSFHIFCRR